MTLITLYEIADEYGIRVDNFVLDRNTNSLAVYIDGKYAIAIDLSKMKTEREVIVALCHEIGHCATHSFYNINNHLDVRSKHEYRADKWAIKKLVPEDELIEIMDKGTTEVWLLAEKFNVTESFMIKACEMYGFYHRAG